MQLTLNINKFKLLLNRTSCFTNLGFHTVRTHHTSYQLSSLHFSLLALVVGVCLVSGKNVPYQNFGFCLDGYKLIGMPMAPYPTLLHFVSQSWPTHGHIKLWPKFRLAKYLVGLVGPSQAGGTGQSRDWTRSTEKASVPWSYSSLGDLETPKRLCFRQC